MRFPRTKLMVSIRDCKSSQEIEDAVVQERGGSSHDMICPLALCHFKVEFFLRPVLTVCGIWQTVSVHLTCLMLSLCACFLGDGIIPG